jgi:hypothetical protein
MFTRSFRPVVVQINHIGRHIRSPSRVDRYPDEESLPILSHRIKNLVRCFSNCAGFCAKQPPRRAPFGYNAWRAVQLSSFPYLFAPPTTQSIRTSGAALHVLRWLLCGPGGHEAWSFGFFSARVFLPACLQSLGSISMAARFGGAPASVARCSRAVSPAGVGASVQLGGVQQGGCPSWCGVPVRGCVWGTAPCGFGIGLLIPQALKYAVTHCIPPTGGPGRLIVVYITCRGWVARAGQKCKTWSQNLASAIGAMAGVRSSFGVLIRLPGRD